ncbi:hypothetical protein [Stenotrophomonas sp. 3diitr2024]|uniref:hypothetical protein n=1 Tax=Stenotrophomonas sp. 3diitr2024 TaxID=3345115 RepID=UPI0035CB9BB5
MATPIVAWDGHVVQSIATGVDAAAVLADMYADLGQRIALVEEDRALDRELRELLVEIRAQRWELYAGE